MARFSGFKYKIEPKSFSTNQAYDTPILVSQSDFSSGVNNSVLQTAINPENEVYYSENLYVDIKSQLKTRPAFTLHTSTPSSAKINDTFGIQGIGDYAGKIIFAINGKIFLADEIEEVYEVSNIPHRVSTELTEIGSCEKNVKVHFLPFHNATYIMDGGPLKRYSSDHQYVENVDNAPYARFGLVYKDRLWVAGEEGYFNDDDNEECHAYGVYVCGPNDAEDWGKHGLKLGTFFEIDPYEVSSSTFPNKISGLELFGESILVFKTGTYSRIYRIDGYSTDTFQIIKVHEGSTCINPFTVTSTPLGVFYLSNDGVRVISDQTQPAELVSSRLDPKALKEILKQNVEAAYDMLSGNYILVAEKEIWVFNVYTRGWFYWIPPSPIICTRKLERSIYFGTLNGAILCLNKDEFREYNETTGDMNATIQSVVETAAYSFGQISIAKYIKNCYVLMEVPHSAFLKFELKSSRPNLQGIGAINQYSIKEDDGLNPEVYDSLWDNDLYIWDGEMSDQTIHEYIRARYGFDHVPLDVIGLSGWDYNFSVVDTDYYYQFNKAKELLRPTDTYDLALFDKDEQDDYIKNKLVRKYRNYLTELYQNSKIVTAFYNNPNYAWDSNRFIWDQDMRFTIFGYLEKMYGIDSALEEYQDVFFEWDLGTPPPEGTKFREWYDARVNEAIGVFKIGDRSEPLQFDTESLYRNIAQLKIPVGLRSTDITLRLTVIGSPIVVQEVSFDGAMLRPAP